MDQDGFDAEGLADLLLEARRSVRQIADLPARLIPPGADEAYRVNARVANRLGWEHLGWKIAATTEAVRNKLCTDGPIYGRTFAKFRHHSAVHLEHCELLDPLVECEFFITLGRDLGPRAEPWTMREVVNAVAIVHAGIEVAECRFPMDALPPLPAILADGSASGRYVFGGGIKDWRSGLTTRRVWLEVDGKKVREGTGADVMGDPIAPLLWLAEQRRRFGDGLKAGEVVSTGSMTGMLPIRHGQHVLAHFGDGATVEVSFDR